MVSVYTMSVSIKHSVFCGSLKFTFLLQGEILNKALTLQAIRVNDVSYFPFLSGVRIEI